MAKIHNEIIVNASVEKIWNILTDLENFRNSQILCVRHFKKYTEEN